MDVDAVANALLPHKAEVEALGVARLLLVGSVAAGRARPDSDVDFIVEFHGPATFLGYMELSELLERVLERGVDITTTKSMRPEIATELLAEARRIA